jgi:Mg2+-importing ATPase
MLGSVNDSSPQAAILDQDVPALLKALETTRSGLTDDEAARRLEHRPGAKSHAPSAWRGLAAQFTNPIQLLLIGAAILSGTLGQITDFLIISFILLASGALSFVQEFRAGNAVVQLLKLVETQCTALRNGEPKRLLLDAVVPGDVVLLSAGSVIPGDGVILEGDSLFVDQAALTGESFPVEKSEQPGQNKVFLGTHVVSGTAAMLVAVTGRETQLGGIAEALRAKRPEGDFQRGVRQLGLMLVELTIFLTLSVLMINLLAHRPILESFMFALALAVGLTPQLLPAIVSLNLSRGAMAMSRDGVIVKRLASIENFGSMSVLCSDKTGTLTLGSVHVARAVGPTGKDSAAALELSQLNAIFESGYVNPIDQALRASAPETLIEGVTKLGELPYDFQRKRLSVLVERNGSNELISKGALTSILECCSTALGETGAVPIEPLRPQIERDYAAYSSQGFRVLGIASRAIPSENGLRAEDEHLMTYVGMLLLEDPLRPESRDTISRLRGVGIELKMITGDNRHVSAHLGAELGLTGGMLTGADLDGLSDDALMARAAQTSVFSEIVPRQKQRIILALKQSGAVVGYIGDGINDGPALHAADVSISVANAVDVAKEAADFVMLNPDLSVLINAVKEGRRTFANTMKYIFMATSANFGNMFSLAGASLLIPFLPLLAKQVLLTNLLTDLPEMTIAGDNVDDEILNIRQKWDVLFLRKFMFIFGLLSSLFDFSTFAVLLWLKATPELFRTAWFTESVLSASLIVLVFRSRRRLGDSLPSKALLSTTIATCIAVLLIPITPLAAPLGFVPLTGRLFWMVLGIVALYVATAEFAKLRFFRAAREA